MTTKRIVWQRPDGGISITAPAESMLPGEPEQMYLDRIAIQAARPGWVRLPDQEADVFPQSRRFRDCWRAAQVPSDPKLLMIAPDLPLSREQVLAEVRAERDAKLTASDKDKARLDDVGTAQQKTDLAAYRQSLRDLPVTVAAELDAAKDVESLEKYTPAWPVKA